MTRQLTGESFHKALAVRAQLQLHEAEQQLYLARAEVARLLAQQLAGGLPTLEMQFLAELDAPQGARFDWHALSFDAAPTDAPQPPAEALTR